MTSSQAGIALFVFAHPDDETLLAGALIAKLVHDGWLVHLLCVAPGDDDDLAARMELAAAELGIASVGSLRFAPDGNSTPASVITSSPPLLSAPETVVASQITGKIVELAPDMIVTHSPSGDYGHPDHAYCHRVTISAAKEAAPSAAIYALAWSSKMLRLNRIAARIFGSLSRASENSLRIEEHAKSPGLPVTETHDVSQYLSTRKRAARHYSKEMSRGPLPLRILEAAPTRLQRPVLGKARLSRVQTQD